MDKDTIPFNIDLKFIKAYDVKHDNQNEEWPFSIKAEVDNNKIIPDGSILVLI